MASIAGPSLTRSVPEETTPAAHASDGRLGLIEAGRAIAAISVVCFHADTVARAHYGDLISRDIFSLGERGVDFFFVLSGFIIAHVHAADLGKSDRVRAFLLKRATRIYPLLWFVAISSMLANYIFDGESYSVAQITTSLTLLPSIIWPIPTPSWTLRHEVLFYAAFALLVFSKRMGVVVIVLWAGGSLAQMALLFWGHAFPGVWAMIFSPIGFQFMFGTLAASVYKRALPHLGPWALCIGTALVLIMMTCSLVLEMPRRHGLNYTDGYTAIWDLAFGLAFGVLVLGLALVSRSWRVPNGMLALGAASYSIYLVHAPVLAFLGKAVGPMLPHWLLIGGGLQVAMAACAVAAGVGVHFMFEKPALRFLRQKIR